MGVRTLPATRRSDLAFGALGASLIVCAFLFALGGTPRLPSAPMVLIGIPSPLTGMTRSFVALSSGDITAALLFHPLGPLCFLACAVGAANAALTVLSGMRLRIVDRLLSIRHAGLVVAAAFLVVWIRQIVVFS